MCIPGLHRGHCGSEHGASDIGVEEGVRPGSCNSRKDSPLVSVCPLDWTVAISDDISPPSWSSRWVISPSYNSPRRSAVVPTRCAIIAAAIAYEEILRVEKAKSQR